LICTPYVRRRTDSAAARAQIYQMDWTDAAAEWVHFRCQVHSNWQELTESQLDTIAGERARLGEKICETYRLTSVQAEQQICSFEARSSYFREVSSR
jgi:hypothetical protein